MVEDPRLTSVKLRNKTCSRFEDEEAYDRTKEGEGYSVHPVVAPLKSSLPDAVQIGEKVGETGQWGG